MRRINIVQGEHVAIGTPGAVISTLLGSCIAVCLFDGQARVGGMNHFLLGQPEAGAQLNAIDMQRYGVHAMELLINAMMQQGASRNQLKAHIYGGANVVAGLGGIGSGIGSGNAAFARRFIETEGIAIGHVDTGGTRARKVEFLPYDGKARATYIADAPPVQALKPVALAAAGGDLELF